MPNFALVMWEILIDIIVIWLLYRLVFDFIVPVYQSTRQVKKQMQDVHRHMQDFYRQSAPPQNPTASKGPSPDQPPAAAKRKEGEYIDYEEVKGS